MIVRNPFVSIRKKDGGQRGVKRVWKRCVIFVTAAMFKVSTLPAGNGEGGEMGAAGGGGTA